MKQIKINNLTKKELKTLSNYIRVQNFSYNLVMSCSSVLKPVFNRSCLKVEEHATSWQLQSKDNNLDRIREKKKIAKIVIRQ